MKKRLILGIIALLLVLMVVPACAAAPAEPIKIGVLLPLTGVGAYGGEQCRLGFEMGLEESGYKAAGREIRLFVEDTEGAPPTTVTKARKLIEKEKVHMFFGPWFEHTSLALKGIVIPWGRPIVFPMAAAIARTMEIPNSLNFSYTDEQITVPYARYAYEKLGYRGAILVASDYAWGHDTLEAYAEGFRRAGGTVVDEIYIPLDTMDMSPYLDKMRAHAAEADFIWDFVIVADGVRLHRQFFEAGLHEIFDRFPSGDVIPTGLLYETGLADVGAYSGYAWFPEVEIAANKKFIQGFENKYPGKAADWFAACGYQGAKIILTALEDIEGKAEDKEAFLSALIGVRIAAADNIYTEGVLTFDPTYRAPILDQYIARVVEVDGKPAREMVDVIRGTPPKLLKGFKE